jgi:hypothetical protein
MDKVQKPSNSEQNNLVEMNQKIIQSGSALVTAVETGTTLISLFIFKVSSPFF